MRDGFELTLRCSLSPQETWARLWDITRHTAAVPLTTLHGPDELCLGSQFTARTQLGRVSVDDQMVVTAWDPPHHAAITKIGARLRGEVTVDLIPTATGSQIRWRQTVRVPGVPQAVTRAALPLIRTGYRRTLRKIVTSAHDASAVQTAPGIHRFEGYIAGVGSTSGMRLVLGAWHTTEHGPFADVMIAHPDGHRELIAPDEWVADFVQSTYSFDTVRIASVRAVQHGRGRGSRWEVEAGPLTWRFTVGSRRPLGYLLGLQPPWHTQQWWAKLIDPIAGLVWPGVATWGTAGNGRTEWYAATDIHGICTSQASYDGQDVGAIAPISNPGFGFSSTPPQPSLTTVISHVQVP